MDLPDQYKYIYICLIFNIGDYVSRRYYQMLGKISFVQAHLLNLLKCLLTYYNLLALSSTNVVIQSLIIKTLYVLLFSFLNGFLCVTYIEFSRQGLLSIYDKQRAGSLISICVKVGLISGGILTKVW